MHPLIANWPYAAVFWAVTVVVYLPEMLLNRRSRKLKRKQDAGSFLVVVGLQAMSMGGAFVVAFTSHIGILVQQRLWFWLGLGTLVAGSLLRRHCFRMLGSSFTAVVVVTPDQHVVERGAYRWIRHPSYTAGIMMFAGQALALGNWIGVLIVFTASVVAYAYRVSVEERALVETLGEPYRAYMQRTKRFIPRII